MNSCTIDLQLVLFVFIFGLGFLCGMIITFWKLLPKDEFTKKGYEVNE